jgi:hypothetical protein
LIKPQVETFRSAASCQEEPKEEEVRHRIAKQAENTYLCAGKHRL